MENMVQRSALPPQRPPLPGKAQEACHYQTRRTSKLYHTQGTRTGIPTGTADKAALQLKSLARNTPASPTNVEA